MEQQAKNRLMNILGDYEMGTVTDEAGKTYKVTWKNQNRETLPIAKLKKEAPAIYEALKEAGLITQTTTRILRM